MRIVLLIYPIILKKRVYLLQQLALGHTGCLSSSTQEIPALENTAQSVNSHLVKEWVGNGCV